VVAKDAPAAAPLPGGRGTAGCRRDGSAANIEKALCFSAAEQHAQREPRAERRRRPREAAG
jgi:hypothetical protein